jgi:hypothetical protein
VRELRRHERLQLNDLIEAGRLQARRSDAPVRAAALLHIARVLTALEPETARRTFEEGLAAIATLDWRDRQALLEEAAMLAAAVAPERAMELLPRTRDFLIRRILHIMLEYGHSQRAMSYLETHADPKTFPFSLVPALIDKSRDDETRLKLLRRAIEFRHGARFNEFAHVFGRYWTLLPADEARDLARKLVEEQPDMPVSARVGPELRFTSGRQFFLFEILHVLRRVDPALADALIQDHDELRAAAERYPFGMESMTEESRAHAPAQGGGYAFVGAVEDFPFMRALMDAEREGNFEPAFEKVLDYLNRDRAPASPNRAVKECWPSTHAFRQILYKAGKKLGAGAASFLDRIPDPDVRLFAQIEFAAALAGLPQWSGTRREYRPRPMTAGPPTVVEPERGIETEDLSGSGPGGPRIRCPKCNWSPRPGDLWSCKCRHQWNTFDTGGVCPNCLYQWTVTQCLSCHQISPHSDWYTTG